MSDDEIMLWGGLIGGLVLTLVALILVIVELHKMRKADLKRERSEYQIRLFKDINGLVFAELTRDGKRISRTWSRYENMRTETS